MKVGEFSEYEGYRGTIEYDSRFDAWFGHVIDVDDVNYAGFTIEELYDQFKVAVREYLEREYTETNTDNCSDLPLLYTDCSVASSGFGDMKEYEIVLCGVNEFGKKIKTKPVVCGPQDIIEIFNIFKRYCEVHTI